MANQNLKITIKAFDKTKGAFSSATRGIKSIAKSIFSMKTALTAVVGATGLALLIKQSIDSTDALAKTAAKIGTTTESLGALQYAAKLTGVETNTLNMAMQRFTRRAAEAAKGTGEAQQALRDLNIDANDLVQMPLDQRMLVLADAFSEVENESEKLALAFKLFDSEGAALVNTLNEGRISLEAMFKDAQTLGIIMSTGAAKGVEAASDSLTKFSLLLRGIRDQITAALAPIIVYLSDLFTQRLKTAIAGTNGSISEFANLLVKEGLMALAGFVFGIGKSLQALKDFGNEISATYQKAKNFFFGDENPITKTFTTDLPQRIQKVAESILNFAENSTFAQGAMDDVNKKGQEGLDIWGKWEKTFKDVAKAIPTIEQSMRSMAETVRDSFTQGFMDAITGAKSFADAMKATAKTVVDALLKMMVQYYITKPLLDLVGGALGIPSTSGKAIGGSVQAGQPYMVGERGAEMFVPNQSGTIIPNDKLGGSGTVINQTINVSTGVQSTVRAEIATLMPQIANATKQAVADARMRGGSYSKALVGA